jgi:hypothetical protein
MYSRYVYIHCTCVYSVYACAMLICLVSWLAGHSHGFMLNWCCGWYRGAPLIAAQVIRSSHMGPAADVYSFAIIMWELLTWQQPFADMMSVQVGGRRLILAPCTTASLAISQLTRLCMPFTSAMPASPCMKPSQQAKVTRSCSCTERPALVYCTGYLSARSWSKHGCIQ